MARFTYDDLIAAADRHFGKVASEHSDQLACRKGCVLCCFGLFEISRLDLARLEAGIAALPPDVRERVEGESDDILARHPHPDDWEEVSEEERDAFFIRTAGVKCPMLDPSGGCSVYADRPLLCRTFGLPIRQAKEWIGDECGLNFTTAPGKVKHKAAWDLAQEEGFEAEELTIPQAVVLLRRVRKAKRRPRGAIRAR